MNHRISAGLHLTGRSDPADGHVSREIGVTHENRVLAIHKNDNLPGRVLVAKTPVRKINRVDRVRRIYARRNEHHFRQFRPDDPARDHHVASSIVPLIVPLRSSAFVVPDTVIVTSSPALTTLLLAWFTVLSEVEALLAPPPNGVPLILTTTVAVPTAVLVVTSVIVNPSPALTMTG